MKLLRLKAECPESIGIKRDEVIAEPAALGEIVPEIFLFGLVKAFQVELQLHAERTHRTVTDTGFLAVLFDCHVLPDAR